MGEPSRTITGHCRDDWVHPLEHRAGTVREMAALQSYPNDYVFKGPIMALNYVKFNFQYRQVGNSVPVLLAKAIGETILQQLKTTQASKLDDRPMTEVTVSDSIRYVRGILSDG
jgi:DNA (cytosine-5)-methyltransferase 1